jgi:subtilisin family serine protease
VAATNEQDDLASYSNYGDTTVDVAAPGGSGTSANIYSTVPPERETLFWDNFEFGGFNWITGGIYELWSLVYDPFFRSTVIRDSVWNYSGSENSYIQTANPINVKNCRGLHISFLIQHFLNYNFDFLYLEGSSDGFVFVPFRQFTGISPGIISFHTWTGGWASELRIDNLYLRFRLISSLFSNNDGVYIDDIVLTGLPWVFDGNEYGYKSGTSMAAPVVSGIAGLIWSYKPSLTHLEVKRIILNSVDALPSLSGKVLTGGRVNAHKALLAAKEPPVPDSEGMFFFIPDQKGGGGAVIYLD